MASSHVEKATEFLRGLSSGDQELTTRHLSPDGFVQHDPAVADGVDGAREQASRSNGRLEIVRVLEDGPFVVAHGQHDDGEEKHVFFAVIRFEKGFLVEHWRFATPLAPPNRSGHTQTDGPTGPDRGQDTDSVKALVRDYDDIVHVGGQHDRIGDYMAGDLQIRHEPGVQDGVAAFRQDLAMLTRSRTIDDIVLLAGQGDLVFIAARGTHGSEPCAYIDLYRVEAGKLVEHWGFSQACPSPEQSRNGNGML